MSIILVFYKKKKTPRTKTSSTKIHDTSHDSPNSSKSEVESFLSDRNKDEKFLSKIKTHLVGLRNLLASRILSPENYRKTLMPAESNCGTP